MIYLLLRKQLKLLLLKREKYENCMNVELKRQNMKETVLGMNQIL